MNYLKRLGGRSQPEPAHKSQDHSLGLTHLRKLFAEFRHPSRRATQEEQEDKLYNMIPLFCKVFGEVQSTEMTEKFGDVLQFCSHLSKLMVTEIRRRASNQSTEAASCAIVKFLEIESPEANSNGWMLLTALDLLASGSQALIDCMTAASLPSTLVKCLYLFFDLPEIELGDVVAEGSQFSPTERRILLQKVFVQVLVRLCSHMSPAEELARKDDLSLLFSAITSWCPPHNAIWRKSAAEVLITLSRHGLTSNVVRYIHDKGCVRHCIENMQRIQELSPLELVEMFVTVFCFLKDSSEVSQTLLDDFRSCGGYGYLSEFLLRLESDTREESQQALRNLVLLVGSLTTCGFTELKPSQASSSSLYQIPGFSVPQPVGKGVSVRNIQAFLVLQSVFLKGTASHLCVTVLDVISSVYHQDNANYFILEPHHTLSQFAEKIHLKPPDVQVCAIMPHKVTGLQVHVCAIMPPKVTGVQVCAIMPPKVTGVHVCAIMPPKVTCLQVCARMPPKTIDVPVSHFKPSNVQVPVCHLEPLDVQEKFFELLEFVVFDLNFVPCKELISISILIKTNHSISCSILCVKTLIRILQHHSVYKDVFREVGILEVMVTCLNRYAALFKDSPSEGQQNEPLNISKDQCELGDLVMECLTALLTGNNNNAGLFRECGGARCAHNMVSQVECRQQILNIIQQLILSSGGDDDMGTLLGLMHSSPVLSLELKTHILKSLLVVLRESHRSRTVFRKVNGFVYVMSVLVSMEGCLADPPKPPWDTVDRIQVTGMLKIVFSTLTVAMRYEPANAKFFESEVRYDSLTEAVRLLGCFTTTIDVQSVIDITMDPEDSSKQFEDFFWTGPDIKNGSRPVLLQSSCMMLKLLYNMALDNFDRPTPVQPQLKLQVDSPKLKRNTMIENDGEGDSPKPKRASTGSINIPTINHCEQIVVHAGAVLSVFHLLPAVEYDTDHKLTVGLQNYVAQLVKGILYTERNQQIMCEAGMPHELLSHGYVALADETHPLHSPLRAMFERLSAQSLTPRDLRDFLRLGSPLNSRPIDEMFDGPLQLDNSWSQNWPLSRASSVEERKTPIEVELKIKTAGEVVPLTRVKCLVSMTTPKDARINGAVVTPAFIEFDMSTEGFGCLYLPSIAPQGPPTPSVVSGVVGSNDSTVIGGMGAGERVFPPQAGMTFSSWFCVDSFSGKSDAHPVRLLTLVRNLQGRDENLVCLSVTLTSRERSLIVSTQESTLPNTGQEHEQEPVLNDNCVRFWYPELTQEGQWHHLVLIFHRAGIMKNSNVSLFVDGEHVQTQKLHYVSPNLGGGGTASPTAFTSVYAYIGTPPQLRRNSKLTWRQGACHLIEDIVATSVVKNIYNLGPTYVGSFQAPNIAKIRKAYNKVDSKSIAKQLAMSAHDNATPIRILTNSAGHLFGPARSLGAILIGYLGVRTFCPRPVAKMLENVGGASALLGLIAMATDVEGLYAAVKALVCVVKSNKSIMKDLDRIRGYQTLAMLFKRKQDLLNSHILHLTFSLIGTIDSGKESSLIPNKKAFEDLLCDLEVWHEAPLDLQRSLYEHFYELLTESSDQSSNFQLMREIGLISRLLHILKDPKLTSATINIITSVITVLLQGPPDSPSLLKLGQFIVSTLPQMSSSEKNVAVNGYKVSEHSMVENGCDDSVVHTIKLRNQCLEILVSLLTDPNPTGVNPQICDEITRVLGFDWLSLFVQGHVHSSTVILALRILLIMLQNHPTMQKFKDGASGGGWLKNTEPVLKQHVGVMLGLNISTKSKGQKRELNQEVCQVPGFTSLQWLLPKHMDIPNVYFLLMALLLGQNVFKLPSEVQFNIDAVWTVIFGVPASKPLSAMTKDKQGDLCPDAALVILCIFRNMLNQNLEERTEPWLQDYPRTLMQFFLYLYHNHAEFSTLASTHEFINSLAATLFPFNIMESDGGDVTTPTEEYKPFPEVEGFVKVGTPEKNPLSSFLTGHPARKMVIDFIRTIIVDSFSQQMLNRPTVTLDVVLEASPDNATRAQRREFQTEVLQTVMDHLLAADVLLGDQSALPNPAIGNYTNMANNVFYFASRVVDKLWQGVYTRESKEVFEFISKLISQAKRKSSGVSLDLIYRSLNRTILFQLSRPIRNVAVQATVLEALHKLTNNRSLVFGPGNYDQDFLVCLCYCLLQLTGDPNTAEYDGKPMMTTWHVNIDPEEDDHHLDFLMEGSGVPEGHQLVGNAAKRVWEELYSCKKHSLQEVFKTQLNSIEPGSNSSDINFPDLNFVRGLIQEYASKVWLQYAETERKINISYSDRLPTQIQSKLQKVGSGVWRLATRKNKEKIPTKMSPASNVHMTDFISWTLTHMSIVRDLVELQFQQYNQGHNHMEKYMLEEWAQTETELLRERGLWGPTVGSRLDKWQLDSTEGPSRMRKRMVKNELFYHHYPYRPDMEDSPLKYKIAMSYDSKEYFERFRSQTLVGVGMEDLPIQRGVEDSPDGNENGDDRSPDDITRMSKLLHRPSKTKSTDLDDDNDEGPTTDNAGDVDKGESQIDGQGEGQTNNKTDNNQAILRILGEGEKITNIFRCARIQGLDTAEGLLLFGREYFYVIDGFTMLRTREIRDIDSLPSECSKFAYEDIREVHKRRYLLQPIAVEVFSSDGQNYLLAFPRKLRNKVYAKFLSVATSMTDNAQQSVSGQKVGAKIEAGSGLISTLIGEKSVTQRWERGEINNFQYLMHLNTLAGRSYNDLMQYPVFPWILADYDSEELDLYNEATFRDLSKPMGAQTPDRLKQFKKRYHDWDDPQGETPPYHYGTHYSSAMIVASYLVRMEPFTQHFLKLQGGHFDLADRMFHSVKENWLSASKNNMADVKELIPEFFYLPEFLCNSNNYDLGCKQSGVELGDVVLPTWAKSDTREFIRAHREALESDYVSAHLHEWIDLIFGYKQQGPLAVDAVNVFHHLFYEGNVDIYNIDDPLKKNATIGFINNFGQIPKQLFKKPHPQKRLNIRLNESLPMGTLPGQDKLFFHNVDNMKPTKQAIKELKGAVGQIIHTERYVLAVEQNKVLIPPTYNKYLAWGFADLSVRIGNYESDKATQVFECLDNGEILCASCPNAKIFITGGTSCVVNVWENRQKEKKVVFKQPLYGHTETVTCLASSQAYNVIISGSRDRTCIIWDLSRLLYVRQLRGHIAPVAAVCINELTGDIATCAGTYLYVWSINGEEIACVNTATLRSQQILCLTMSQMNEWDNRNVILTGSSDGVVRMWSVEHVQVPCENKKEINVKEEKKTLDVPNNLLHNVIDQPLKQRRDSCNSYDGEKTAADKIREFKDLDVFDLEPELGSSVDSGSNFSSHMRHRAKMKDEGRMETEDSSAYSSVSERGDDLMSNDSEVCSLSGKSYDLSIDMAVDALNETPVPSQSDPDVMKTSTDTLSCERSQSQPDLKDISKETEQLMKSSLSSDFEVLSEKDVRSSPKTVQDLMKKYSGKPRNALREGFKWQRQLVFRSKLTMHTAYERKDNRDPASVTSLAVSKDHRTVYVGDSKGRIYSWTVTDQPGRVVADHWMKDEGADSCLACGVKFSFSERKHHCRNCGQLLCSKCSRFETEIRKMRIMKPVRVCQACYNIIKAQQAADSIAKT
ncbi:hypothetical protein FSP39_018631 [Pinctada imbricata]|uniref:WD repeat and FYVE domain containing 3 n=1 Tax=Pinctada imbricata TaxID=66713 RepID=A0AA88YE21_PINIB|nr:hypothetical protein FSP39_018631 [Pinctada imbricata]